MHTDLATEARVFHRYFVGREAPAGLIERYVVCESGAGSADAESGPLLRFALARPWAVGPLDAACGLFRPAAQLRRKLLRMAALLETAPQYADWFLPQTRPSLRLVATLLGLGLVAAGQALVGATLLFLLERRR
jgi:hypothetical protein